MSERIWKTQTGGQVDRLMDVSEEMGHGGGALLMVSKPDVVRLPAELGGSVVRVRTLAQLEMECPKCLVEGVKQVLELEEVDVGVVACPSCQQYVWVRVPSGGRDAR